MLLLKLTYNPFISSPFTKVQVTTAPGLLKRLKIIQKPLQKTHTHTHTHTSKPWASEVETRRTSETFSLLRGEEENESIPERAPEKESGRGEAASRLCPATVTHPWERSFGADPCWSRRKLCQALGVGGWLRESVRGRFLVISESLSSPWLSVPHPGWDAALSLHEALIFLDRNSSNTCNYRDKLRAKITTADWCISNARLHFWLFLFIFLHMGSQNTDSLSPSLSLPLTQSHSGWTAPRCSLYKVLMFLAGPRCSLYKVLMFLDRHSSNTCNMPYIMDQDHCGESALQHSMFFFFLQIHTRILYHMYIMICIMYIIHTYVYHVCSTHTYTAYAGTYACT